jgi:hypothetical protein
MAAGRKFRCGAARAHHARVPKPFIDALSIQSVGGSAPLLRVGLKLGL